MIPKNNIPLFSEQNGTSSSNNSQQFRSTLSLNPNLIVTQQQQPNRVNATYQNNSPSGVQNSQLEVLKRLIEQHQQQQSGQSLHLNERTSQSQTNKVNQQSLPIDRSQMIRIPTTHATSPNFYNSLFLINPNSLLQNDKCKIQLQSANNHNIESTTKDSSSQSGQHVILNNQSAGSNPTVAINTTLTQPTQNQSNNQTVLSMSNDQLLEAFNRTLSQQSNNASKANTNMLIQTENIVQQLFNGSQKQLNNRTNQQGYMVLGSQSKPIVQNSKMVPNNLSVSTSIPQNPAIKANNLVIKTQSNQNTTNIPLWNLLDKLSNNEQMSEYNRQSKTMRELQDDNCKILQNQSQSHQLRPNITLASSSNVSIGTSLPLSSLPSVSLEVSVNNNSHSPSVSNLSNISTAIANDQHHLIQSITQNQTPHQIQPRDLELLINYAVNNHNIKQNNLLQIKQHNYSNNMDNYNSVNNNNRSNIVSTQNSNINNSSISHSNPLVDTHQILRDSKETSILLPNSNLNCNFSNDDMINQHFKKSLIDKLDLKKSALDCNNEKNNSNNKTHLNHELLSTIISQHQEQQNGNNAIRLKSKSLIDLDRPDNFTNHINNPISSSSSNQLFPSNPNNAKCSIKQKAESMVEDMLNQNYKTFDNNNNTNSNVYSNNNVNQSVLSTHLKNALLEGNNKLLAFSQNNSLILQHQNPISSIQTSPSTSHNNYTNHAVDARNSVSNNVNSCKLKYVNENRRDNPSKSDLPLKKRIMLDFNENCTHDESNDDSNDIDSMNGEMKKFVQNSNKKGSEGYIPQTNFSDVKHNNNTLKPKRKRTRTDSSSNDSKTVSISSSVLAPPYRPSVSSHDNDNKIISSSTSPTVKKRRGRIPGTGKNQRLKEQHRAREIAKIDSSGTEKTWPDLISSINKPPDMEKITSRTLCNLDLEPLKVSKEAFFQIGACCEIAPRMVKCRSCRQQPTSSSGGTSHVNDFANSTGLITSNNNCNDEGGSVKSSSKDSNNGVNSSNNSTSFSSFCRFHGFRKLQYSIKGTISQAGFCKSFEADELDLSLWRMFYPTQTDLPIDAGIYLIESLSEVFCQIIDVENQFIRDCYSVNNDSSTYTQNHIATANVNGSISSNSSTSSINDEINNNNISTNRRRNDSYSTVGTVMSNTSRLNTNNIIKSEDILVWKRPVQGVREMCDVCDTSIFNTHWICRKCGYSVCVECFNERQERDVKLTMNENSNAVGTDSSDNKSTSIRFTNNNSLSKAEPPHQNTRGAYKNRLSSNNHPWALCTANRQSHNPDQLLKAELIPAKVLNELKNRMHTIARLLNLKLHCNYQHDDTLSGDLKSKTKLQLHQIKPLNIIKQESSDSLPYIEPTSAGCETDLHLLADLALKEVTKDDCKDNSKLDTTISSTSSNCITTVTSVTSQSNNNNLLLRPPPVLSPPHQPEFNTSSSSTNINNDNNINNRSQQNADNVFIQNSNDSKNDIKSENNDSHYVWISVSSKMKMLHLLDSQNPNNFKTFQKEWLCCHPLIVSGCNKSMNEQLWTPEKFLEDFENEAVQLVDCETGFPVSKGSMRSFWDGFQCYSKRISADRSKRPACLKLKDWPPTDDFSELLPQRCQDILNGLPISQYTGHGGPYNLARHLPDFFVRPDLGPKLYNAYGMPKESKLGTTNLHMDIADAVNVMLFVGVTTDQAEREQKNALDTLKETHGIDSSIMSRAQEEPPGALWHIFLTQDVPLLRRFLHDVLLELDEPNVDQPGHDPIHDQLVYLDRTLLYRLKLEYQVEPYAIVQFLGDAVFIPAGCPHQVRNLHSCMKAANDFVSPENIDNCLRVTKEFSRLSNTHANHEDKLQAKNMIYHTMKDAVATLIMKCGSALRSNGKVQNIKFQTNDDVVDDRNNKKSNQLKSEETVLMESSNC